MLIAGVAFITEEPLSISDMVGLVGDPGREDVEEALTLTLGCEDPQPEAKLQPAR